MSTSVKLIDIGTEIDNPAGAADLYMIAIPMPTYKVIADAAAKQGMTFGQFMGRALSEALQKNESSSSTGPKLLLG